MRESGIIAVALRIAVACGARGLRRTAPPAGAVTLNWFIFNEPSGGSSAGRRQAAARQQSGGRYKINFEYLPSQADQQREQLVRRLGAKDDDARPARAWTSSGPASSPTPAGSSRARPRPRRPSRKDVFQRSLKTARYKDKLWPCRSGPTRSCSGTARTASRQPAEDVGRDDRHGREDRPREGPHPGPGQPVRGPRRLGQLAHRSRPAASILDGPDDGAPRPGADREGARDHAQAGAARSASPPEHRRPPTRTARGSASRPAARPSRSTTRSSTRRPKANAPKIFKEIGWAPYPRGRRRRAQPSRRSAGSTSASAPTQAQGPRLRGRRVPAPSPSNQLDDRHAGGLPPMREDALRPAWIDEGRIPLRRPDPRRRSRTPAPRPSQSPAYQDLSLAIQHAVHPHDDIDPKNLDAAYNKLQRQRPEGRRARGPAVSTSAPTQAASPPSARRAASGGRGSQRPREGRAQARAACSARPP